MITCIYSILGTTSINIGVKCFDYIDYLLSAETPETNTSLRKRFAIHVSYKIPPPPCYSYSWFLFTCCRWWRKQSNLRKMEKIHCHLRKEYFITVNLIGTYFIRSITVSFNMLFSILLLLLLYNIYKAPI
jgi:hypothetical protein